MVSLGEFYQAFKEEILLIIHELFQKTQDEGIFPNSMYKPSNTMIPKPDKKRKQQTNTHHECICKNAQYFNKLNPKHIKKYNTS